MKNQSSQAVIIASTMRISRPPSALSYVMIRFFQGTIPLKYACNQYLGNGKRAHALKNMLVKPARSRQGYRIIDSTTIITGRGEFLPRFFSVFLLPEV